jgi:hypothetical protein
MDAILAGRRVLFKHDLSFEAMGKGTPGNPREIPEECSWYGKLDETVEVAEVSNRSTGFCPEPESWPDVAAALDRIGVAYPGGFTREIVFRWCEHCRERNIVKDGWFVCGVYEAELPAIWNF